MGRQMPHIANKELRTVFRRLDVLLSLLFRSSLPGALSSAFDFPRM
jgi:hypothetical protein